MVKQCVILAGGLGTRMRPLTGLLPKALLPAGGRPFAEYQLNLLAREGVTDVVYCIGHMGDQIRAFVGGGEAFGLRVRYVDEGANLRGTWGALALAFSAGVLDPEFFVLYGDSYTRLCFEDVRAAWATCGAPALMCVLRNKGQWDSSNAIYEPGRPLVYDKMHGHPRSAEMQHIDYGLCVLDRDLFEPGRVSPAADLSAVMGELSRKKLLAGFEVHERFYEIGSPQGLADFEEFVAAGGAL